jgi:ribosome recycling factor
LDDKTLSEDQKKYREGEIDSLTKSRVEKIEKAVDAK